MFGWMGQLLRVNLTTGDIKREKIDEKWLSAFLGGRGLGDRILFSEVGPEVEALAPENKLIFAVGPLTGTKAPMAGRFTVTAKSPLTGTVFSANGGGAWGVRLKQCGYDALVVEGQARTPVYLFLDDAGAEIRDGAQLWGLDVAETNAKLTAQGGQDCSAVSIGPAGENRVKLAAIMNEGNQAVGRGGLGAVMGAKNLKAIVAKGSRQVTVADPEQLDFMVYETNKWLKANPITSQGLPEFGTAVMVNLFNEIGAFPTRNFQENCFAGAEALSGETLAERYTVKRTSCYGCTVDCSRVTKTGRIIGEGPEYETLGALGAACGIDDLEAILEANYLCNRLGLDSISVGATIACAMELAEKGLLPGSDLAFGQGHRLQELIRAMAYRQGLGAEMGEGSRELGRRYGGEEYAMQVKGLELPAYDPRGLQGMGLGFATSNQGGCHLQGYMVGPEVLGIPKMVDRFTTGGKAGLTIFQQNVGAAMDSLILCRFAGLAVSEEYFARLLTAVVGKTYQTQDLHRIGERIWNLERLYNLREGLGRQEDTLPSRLLKEAVVEGPSRGHTVQLEPMLKEYYRFRGWDAQGQPTPAKLAQLGLEGLTGA